MAGVILVTNDDGIHAPGLAALAAALEPLGEVYVVAPDREQSAVGHALTLHRPLRVEQLGERRYAVNGTPSDCVNLGVLGLLPERPVLVASGVSCRQQVAHFTGVAALHPAMLLRDLLIAPSRVGSGFPAGPHPAG